MVKNKIKKIAAMAMVATVLVGTIGANTAFAESKNATGYGTLKGTLSGSTTSGTGTTTVSKNTDNANITLAIDLKNSAGENMVKTKFKSSRGVTIVKQDWSTSVKGITCAYGAHGVQGGTKYKADVVYTYSSL